MTWVPHETRAACRDTHTHRVRPGVDLCQFGVTRIWPSPISPLPCRPFRQTGLARGGVRRGATKTSHRDGTGCDLRRCGGALPFPHTVTHFSRISIGISFLLSIKPPPKLKLPRLFGVGCVTRANLGWPRAGSVIASTLLLSLSLVGWAGGFAPSTKQPSKAYPPRQQFATIFKVVTFFLQPSSRTHPDTAVPARGESDRIFGISLLFSLWLGYAMTDRDRETQNTSHTWSLGSVTIITGTLEGILASSGFWFFKRAISCHISPHLFYT